MQNIGEEITGEYLKIIKGCEFVEFNLYTPDIQGEIDVFGLNNKEKTIYVCEVAIHLVTGLQYVSPSTRRPDNVVRFLKKFNKDIDYAEKYFPKHKKHFMLWSPIIKDQKKAKRNQRDDVKKIQDTIYKKRGYKIDIITNHRFQECLNQLRQYAAKETKELKSPVLRLMQIEEKLKKHLR